MNQDRNLLFGVFAVQLRKVTASQMLAAAGAWASDPSKDLPGRLVEDSVLTAGDRDLIQGLVDHAVQAHDGDATKTLNAFGGHDVVQDTFLGTILRNDSGDVSLAPSQQPTILSEPSDALGVSETPGRYTRESEHARGGMGRVLLVHDEHLGRDIALKELLPSLSGSSKSGSTPKTPARASAHFAHRFLQEARVTGQLEHPSIVPVYELGRRTDGSIYYTMKLVKGKSLSQAIKDAGNLRERLKLLPHFVDLCNAIAYAHSRGVIHRDLKPQNVMVGEFGETVVIDWGLAKVLDTEDIHAEGFEEAVREISKGATPDTAETAYGHALGTPSYMPPEQAKGQLELVDQRSDVYSLGAVLYELLAGEAPFNLASLGQILRNVIGKKPTPIRERAKDAPRELIAICERAMEKKPGQRYASPKLLGDEVQRFLNGAVVEAYQYSLAGHLKRLYRQYKPVFAASTVALIVIMVVTAYSILEIDQERATAIEAKGQAEIEREAAVAASKIAEANRLQAETNFQLARSAVDDFVSVSEAELQQSPQTSELQRSILERARGYYEQLLAAKPEISELSEEVASTTYTLAKISWFLDSVEVRIEKMQDAVNALTVVARTPQATVNAKILLSNSLVDLAEAFSDTLNHEDALTTQEEALYVAENFMDHHPDEIQFCLNYARAALLGDWSINFVEDNLSDVGEYETMRIEAIQKALDHFQDINSCSECNPRPEILRIALRCELFWDRYRKRDLGEARASFDLLEPLLEDLGYHISGTPYERFTLAKVTLRVSDVLKSGMSSHVDSEVVRNQAITALSDLVDFDESFSLCRLYLADALSARGSERIRQEGYEEALADLQMALWHLRSLSENGVSDDYWNSIYFNAQTALAWLHFVRSETQISDALVSELVDGMETVGSYRVAIIHLMWYRALLRRLDLEVAYERTPVTISLERKDLMGMIRAAKVLFRMTTDDRITGMFSVDDIHALTVTVSPPFDDLVQRIGLRAGDSILSINERPFESEKGVIPIMDNIEQEVAEGLIDEVRLQAERSVNEIVEITVTISDD